MTHAITPAQVVTYALEIEIEASQERVWHALTEETNAWWLADFRAVAADSVVTFEPEAGGHLVERQPGGGSLLWYTVHMIVPGESVHLIGHSAADYGGPATTLLKLALKKNDAGCVLEVTDSLYGRVEESSVQSLSDGWKQLFTDGLKQHVENRS